MKLAFKKAFPYTVPVLLGYLFLGMAFGILLDEIGYGPGWAFVMSLLIFAGSLQFVAISLLTIPFNPLNTLILTLMINARHITYGISMLRRFRNTGKLKPYLIFALTDETYSLICGIEPPENVDHGKFYFALSLMNHCYWIAGGVLGALIGSLLTFNSTGIDFVLTALFTVILVGQWESSAEHRPAILGIGVSLVCLLLFGGDNFLIPAILLIVGSLIVIRGRLKEVDADA